MKIIKNIREMKSLSERIKRKGFVIGLVPTMGNLHEGHISLVRAARKDCDFLVATIFVNPTQFSPKEDQKKYPRSLNRDTDLLAKNGVNAIFYPQISDIYPIGYKTFVEVQEFSSKLCGKTRPGHFAGVATVVLKLFNIIDPDLAFFGKKDFQQQVIIKKMITDLNMNVKIVSLPTIREKDGMAMSSRNSYLNKKQREEASVLYRSLQFAKVLIKSGERNSEKIKSAIKKMVSKHKIVKIDYISICDPEMFEEVKILKGRTLIAIAANVGKARLIDNIVIAPGRKD